LLHRYFERWISHHIKKLAHFDKAIILLIVYESFSKSFLSGIFKGVGPVVFVILFGVVVLLFFIVFYITGRIATLLKFNREDRITLQFAGSKKSLVHGSVFASILFQGISGAGVLLLPIMMYHAFQLAYISLVARRLQRQEV
jgi:sodium/bile acid cotransporter 7